MRSQEKKRAYFSFPFEALSKILKARFGCFYLKKKVTLEFKDLGKSILCHVH